MGVSQHRAVADFSAQYTALMGPDLGPVYAVLSYDVTLAFASRAVFEQLFGQQGRVEILHDVAGRFFGILRNALLLDLVLQVARLVDRPQTSGRQNLTMQSLSPHVLDPALQLDVEGLVQSACGACRSVVDWRNRRLAHRDREFALSTTDELLPDVKLADIDGALQTFAEILNRLQAHFENGATTAYDWVQKGSADGLFYFLEKGLDAERREHEP